MADGTCGPSNPLQNLQKQSSVDRTVQQDRYIPRQQSKNGFKLSPSQGSEVIEAEFNAFQNASLPINRAFSSLETSKNVTGLHHSQTSHWVSDFMELNFSAGSSTSRRPISLLPEIPLAQQEFFNYGHNMERQQIENSNITQLSNTYEVNNISRVGTGSIVPALGEVEGKLKCHPTELLESQASFEEIFDQEAFARAFEQAAESQKNGLQVTQQEPAPLEQESLSENRSVDSSSSLLDDVHLTQAPIGADAIKYENFSEEHDSSLLSKTASKLLNSVHNDQSLKFQNSQFLELMRQFRDKNATIQGDRVVCEKLEAP